MPYTFTVTDITQVVTATSVAYNTTVTTQNVVTTVTNYLNTVTVGNTINSFTVFTNAIELRIKDLNYYWKGEWATNTTYYSGDLVDYLYSLYLLTDLSDINTPYNSNLTPDQDANWQRIVWHEAPFDHVTVTNDLIVGHNIIGLSDITANNGSVITPRVHVDTISTDTANQVTFSSPVLMNYPVTVNNTLTVTTDEIVQGTLTPYNLSVSNNARVYGTTTLNNALVGGLFTATNVAHFSNTVNIDNTATVGTLNVGAISGSGQVNITAPVKIYWSNNYF
jgi:hypothetical protein